jgi:hypothetical protein
MCILQTKNYLNKYVYLTILVIMHKFMFIIFKISIML